jgi:hypothetical protein
MKCLILIHNVKYYGTILPTERKGQLPAPAVSSNEIQPNAENEKIVGVKSLNVLNLASQT